MSSTSWYACPSICAAAGITSLYAHFSGVVSTMYRASSRACAESSEPVLHARRQPERRKTGAAADAAGPRIGLTAEQAATLQTMEEFHWRLQFIRRPLFKAPIPVLTARDDARLVVIEEDGSINENPVLQLRK
jgi:hypothetical protein